jgi:hypothetical protein
MINRKSIAELNSHPPILIAAAIIELKPDESNPGGIELTPGTAATGRKEGRQ